MAVMPCGWEGNRRSLVALALRHILQQLIHLRAHGLRKGDEHPAYTSHAVRHSFTIYPCDQYTDLDKDVKRQRKSRQNVKNVRKYKTI